MANLTLTDVSKRFVSKNSEHLAVDTVSLHIADGELVSLVGPSGCGKSTMLRVIAGLEHPDSGSIELGGVDVTYTPPQRRKLSMVFQNYAIFPHMTVAQNIGYGLKIAKVAAKERQQRVADAAELVQVSKLLERHPRQLSGGQRQRVAVARALVTNPQLLLLDEPLSNLDAKLRDETRAQLKRLHQRLSNTMVYVTHDQLEALTMSDRIAVMRDGQIQQFGTPAEVYHFPANEFVGSFIGSPAMNFFPGSAVFSGNSWRVVLEAPTQTSIDMPQAKLTMDAERRGHVDVRVGIRPQAFELASRSGESTLSGTVQLVEPIGQEMIVHIALPDRVTVVAQLQEDTSIGTGSKVHLRLRPSAIHLFDQHSGEALFHGRSLQPMGPPSTITEVKDVAEKFQHEPL